MKPQDSDLMNSKDLLATRARSQALQLCKRTYELQAWHISHLLKCKMQAPHASNVSLLQLEGPAWPRSMDDTSIAKTGQLSMKRPLTRHAYAHMPTLRFNATLYLSFVIMCFRDMGTLRPFFIYFNDFFKLQ